MKWGWSKIRSYFFVFLVLFVCSGLSLGLSAQESSGCISCGKKADPKYQLGAISYCTAHGKVSRICAGCHNAVQGSYHLLGNQRRTVCKACSKLPLCDICERPVQAKNVLKTLEDGRKVCLKDYSEFVSTRERLVSQGKIIVSQQLAERLFAQAVGEVIGVFGPEFQLKVPVEKVTLEDAVSFSKARFGPNSGARKSTSQGFANVGLRYSQKGLEAKPPKIHILTGMTKERFLWVSAHEYMHAWQVENHRDPGKMNAEVREGFAQWVACKVAEAHGRHEEIRILQTPSRSPYYTGLMKYLELEKKVGRRGVLEHAKSATSF